MDTMDIFERLNANQIIPKDGIEEEEALHMIDSTIHVRPHLGHSKRTLLRSLCSFDRQPRTVCATRIDPLYLCTFLYLFLSVHVFREDL